MSDRIKVPADVDLEDRLAFGLTFRQLLILVGAAIGAYLIFSVVGSIAPLPFAAAAATPIALIGVGLAFGRLDGLPGDRLALAALRLLLGQRRRVLAPEGVSSPLPGADAVAQPASSPLDVPVRAIFRSGVVELRDGRYCLLATAGGTSFGLRGDEEQVGLVEAYGRWLHSLTEPAGITVRSEPVDLAGKAAALRDDADELPHPALARAARGHADFLQELGDDGGVRRRQIVLTLTTSAKDRDAATATLLRNAEEARELLRAAGVDLRLQDGDDAAALLAHAIDPPGLPTGSYLTGVVTC
jgi:PrgI family protein